MNVSDIPQIESTDGAEQRVPENVMEEPASPDRNPATPEPTVGTGTAMALGCIVGTIVLIGFGLIFLFFATMR